ncbi:MAG: hypothetical protein KBE91_12540 [Bacteroidia bacterium]|nr:hypothetical protein [Bacteroidia bacterium]
MKNLLSSLLPATIIASAIFMGLSFKSVTKQETEKVYEYKQFSTVESVVAGGLGRSRILTTDDKGTLLEKDLLNFYSMVGINFGNIANNDRSIVTKVNEWTNEGWELTNVTAGAQTNISNGSSSSGIFITRYLFRKPKQN